MPRYRREGDLRRLLLRFELLRLDPAADFYGAARIYHLCRREGVTPRGLTDDMIAAVALRIKAVLLAHDAGMGRVAKVVGIEMDDASLHTSDVHRGRQLAPSPPSPCALGPGASLTPASP